MGFITRTYGSSMSEVKDKFDIKELIEFERFCRDNALWDEMKQCYCKDSYVKISWFEGSGYDFVEASSRMADYAPHRIYNRLIWLNGDRAVAIMLATIQIRKQINGVEMEVQSDSKIIYQVQRMDGCWYIAGMRAIYDKDALIPVYPASGISMDKEKINRYRSSYAALSYSLEAEGYEVNPQLPGRDKPELVQSIYDEVSEWLYEKI